MLDGRHRALFGDRVWEAGVVAKTRGDALTRSCDDLEGAVAAGGDVEVQLPNRRLLLTDMGTKSNAVAVLGKKASPSHSCTNMNVRIFPRDGPLSDMKQRQAATESGMGLAAVRRGSLLSSGCLSLQHRDKSSRAGERSHMRL